jgi:exocyst complex protein 7
LGRTALTEPSGFVGQTEYDLINHLFPPATTSALLTIFKSPIKTLNDLLTTQTNTIKRSLNANTFYALELYQTLNGLHGQWEESVRQLLGDQDMEKTVAEAAAAMRGACLRSFPEVLVDVRTPAAAGTRDVGTSSVADITYTVSRLERASPKPVLLTEDGVLLYRRSPIWKTCRLTKLR